MAGIGLVAAIIFLTVTSGCNLFLGTSDSPPEVDLENLTRHWVHSWEEEAENDSVRIYRPVNFREFSPGWFRMQYIFNEDGTCQWFYLAPNDGHHFRDGTWEFDANAANIIHIQQDEQTESFRIIGLTNEILRMKQVR